MAFLHYMNQENMPGAVYQVDSVSTGDGKIFNLSGFYILDNEIVEIITKPIEFNSEEWQKVCEWKEIQSSDNKTTYQFNSEDSVLYADIFTSKDHKKHWVKVWKNNRIQFQFLTYQNELILVMFGIAVGLCLGVLALSALRINCKEQCGEGNVGRIEISLGWNKWRPKCSFVCECKNNEK